MIGDHGRQPQRLVDVVGDEHDRLAGRPVDAGELALQRIAGDRVDRGEGLVHQQELGIGGERAGDADALLLAARQLVRVLAAIGGGIEPQQFEQFVDPRARPAPPAISAGAARWRCCRRHSNAETARSTGSHSRCAGAAPRAAGGSRPRRRPGSCRHRRHQPVDHPQRRRLAAARGAEQHAERAGWDVERQIVDDRAAVIALG